MCVDSLYHGIHSINTIMVPGLWYSAMGKNLKTSMSANSQYIGTLAILVEVPPLPTAHGSEKLSQTPALKVH